MNVLVTGDRGYIGAALTTLILKNGFHVTGVDVDFFKDNKLENLFEEKYTKIRKDIRNIVASDLEGFDAVIHLAALSNDPIGQINPKLTYDINFFASMKLARLSKEVGVKRFLFSSSCSVYGIAKEGIVDEISPVNPQTAYAISKINAENELKKLADDNFCVGILRNSTVYGYSPKFRNDLVVNNLVTCALTLGKIRVKSDGSPWRPLIDVRDLSYAFIEFLKADKDKINGKIINVGFNNNNFQVKDILSLVKKHLPECEIEFTGEHGKDTRSYRVKFDKFKSLFPNFKKEWTLDRSIKDLIKQLKEKKYSKEDFLSGRFTRLVALKKLQESKKINQKLYTRTERS